jgi:hypothetical protein
MNMSDWFQCIVDRDIDESESPRAGKLLHDWFAQEGIICPIPTECVLGNEFGYPPGAAYSKAVEREDPNLFTLRTNGVSIICKREVYHRTEHTELVCSECMKRTAMSDDWGKAVGEWSQHQGPGLLKCPHCGSFRPITEWTHAPPWGFGDLGLRFWNWPSLKQSFVGDIETILQHRLRFIAAKL